MWWLPVIWTIFALAAVGGFIMLAAYWLDIQERADFSFRRRVAWSAGTFLFPLTIPIYAFSAGAAWPTFLRVAAFLPAFALTLFFGFLFGLFS
ncbi:MAG TPA: hypothetical protein VFJ03_05680 [Candidatus Limnocylindria bacterium]|jgi:uncharacterized membrane-anchored protein|nr:hypothetical protein [Candidatus Limnocylindria bacterium]